MPSNIVMHIVPRGQSACASHDNVQKPPGNSGSSSQSSSHSLASAQRAPTSRLGSGRSAAGPGCLPQATRNKRAHNVLIVSSRERIEAHANATVESRLVAFDAYVAEHIEGGRELEEELEIDRTHEHS